MRVIIKDHVQDDDYLDPRLSKGIHDGRLPRFQLQMGGDCKSIYAAAIEKLVDLYGIPKKVYVTIPFESFFAVLNPLDRVLRPRLLGQSKSGGYKLRSPRRVMFTPDNIFRICNRLEGSQYGASWEIPEDIEVRTAGSVRVGAMYDDNSYGLNYLPAEGTREQNVYWVSIDEKKLPYLAGLDVQLTGDNATLSLDLRVPRGETIDAFVKGLKTKLRGVELKVEDLRYEGVYPATGKGRLAHSVNLT